MLTLIALLIPVFIILVHFLFHIFKPKNKLPPGPIIWPLIGNILELSLADPVYPHLALAKLAKKYGNIMGIGFGSTYAVVISGYDEMKEILRKPEVNQDRVESAFVRDRSFNQTLGIIWGVGEAWWEIRKFTLHALKEFGFGKQSLTERLIREETAVVLEEIEATALANNGIWAVDAHQLQASFLNIIWSSIGGYRFDHNDSVIRESMKLGDQTLKILSHNNPYNTFPALKRWFPKLVKHDVHMKVHGQMQNWIKGLIDDAKRKRLQRVDTKAQNFIETFLDNIEKNRGQQSNFTEEQLIVTMMDLFLGGSETTSMVLNWVVLFLTLNPECQRKLKSEIQEGNARFGQVSLNIAGKFPYLNAVLLESARLGNGGPVAPPRLAMRDVNFNGFVIPKGTAVFANTTLIFTDKQFWGDPEIFRPERFLDDSGTIIESLAERVAIFGFGKRACLGQRIAWDSLTMFLMAIFGKFTFEPIKGMEPSPDKPVPAIAIRPRPFSVRVVLN